MRKVVLTLALVFLAGPALAQNDTPRFKIVVDRTRLFVGERLQIALTLEGPGVSYKKPFKLPDLGPYLRLVDVSGPQTKQVTQIINGRMIKSGSVNLTYLLEAKRAGTVTIPAISYNVGNIHVETRPLKIEIIQPQKPKLTPKNTGWKPPSDPFLEVKLDKAEAYVGEQVVATWNLYFRTQFDNARLIREPMAGDFILTDLGTASSLNPVSKKLGQVSWQVAYIKGIALFPIKAGNVVLGPLVIKHSKRSRSRTAFGRRWIDQIVESRSVNIRVKPLPDKGKPDDFTGAVGQFTIKLDRANATMEADTPFKFTLTISGTGHPDYIPKPEIDLPDGFDIYTEAAEKDTRIERGRAFGIKKFKMILVPHVPGDFKLAPFEFSYFDPARRKYRLAKSVPIHLKVSPNRKPSIPFAGDGPSIISSADQDLRYIKPDRSDLEPEGKWLLSSRVLLGSQLFPILAVATALVMRKRRERVSRDRGYARRLRAKKKFKKSLAEAKKAINAGDTAASCANVYHALAGFIADRHNLPEQGMTTAEAIETLEKAGVSEEIVKEADAILGTCDQARFTPGTFTAADAMSLLDRMRDLVKRLEKETGK